MSNDNKYALSFMLSKINELINSKISKLKYDKTFRSAIWNINDNGTYQINYLGNLYDVPNCTGQHLHVGQNVWVKIPSGILKNMHICNV